MSSPISETVPRTSDADSNGRYITAAWVAGLSAFFGFTSINDNMSIGAGIACLGVAGMVAFVCYLIVRR